MIPSKQSVNVNWRSRINEWYLVCGLAQLNHDQSSKWTSFTNRDEEGCVPVAMENSGEHVSIPQELWMSNVPFYRCIGVKKVYIHRKSSQECVYDQAKSYKNLRPEEPDGFCFRYSGAALWVGDKLYGTTTRGSWCSQLVLMDCLVSSIRRYPFRWFRDTSGVVEWRVESWTGHQIVGHELIASWAVFWTMMNDRNREPFSKSTYMCNIWSPFPIRPRQAMEACTDSNRP